MPADLSSYPRPNVAVDLVILTRLGDSSSVELGVVVQRRPDGRCVLPGRFVRDRSTAARTVADLLGAKMGLKPRRTPRLTMLGVYDDPDRDPRGWVVSLAYTTTLQPEDLERTSRDDIEVLPLHGSAAPGGRVAREPLDYDHDDMVTTAVRRARRRYERSPDPLHLLRPPYTLSQLRHVHEAVLDEPLKRDTFNRRMLPFLEPALDRSGEEIFTSATVGRPAQLYVRKEVRGRDPEAGPFPLPRSRP